MRKLFIPSRENNQLFDGSCSDWRERLVAEGPVSHSPVRIRLVAERFVVDESIRGCVVARSTSSQKGRVDGGREGKETWKE